MADHCIEFRLLHPGGALGRSVSGDRLFDDAEDLCVCMDGFDWISLHEKGPYRKILNVPGGKVFLSGSHGHGIIIESCEMEAWQHCVLES